MTSVRRLDLGDPATAEAIVALQRASYAIEADMIGTTDLPPLKETRAQLARCGETFLGAFDDGLVGAISYRRRWGTLDIHRLVVHPDAFGRGIASALIEALPRARRVIVSTAAANAPARELYQRHGFRATAESTVPPGIALVHLERRASAGPRRRGRA